MLVLLLLIVLAGAVHADDACFACHESADIAGAQRVVTADAWKATVHGKADVDCGSCHSGHDDFPHKASEPTEACGDCHADESEALASSVHRHVDGDGFKRPTCASCHGPVHALYPHDDVRSTVHPKRLPQTCGVCHADPKFSAKTGIKLVQPIAAYAASVHGRAVAAGEKAATCSSCHGSHDILSADDPRSRVNRKNTPATCGKCHAEVARLFATSVHGQAVARGIREAPVCTDCHGEHRILGPSDKGSPVFASNVPKMTCGRCHGDQRIVEKFGLKSTSVAAFSDSFHGLAGQAGNLSVAHCASCHGVHDILPSSDPRSHVNPSNLAETCGSCHPGAGSTFTIGAVHVLAENREGTHPAVYWVRIAYLTLIWVVIGAMMLHNLLDLRRKAITPTARPIVPVAARRPRLSLGFRVVHLLLMTSFIVLAWSGFALKYPTGWWAQPLVGWEGQFGLRGWVHRGAAMILLLSFALHAAHLAFDRRARACMWGMLPKWHDLSELRQRIRWFVGARPDMPPSPVLGYAEKLEYLALVWGTMIMAVSGFLLWFENWSLAHLPKWILDVATVVHFYEAVLATLAILVWHFYFVIFDPVVYPMDTGWLTGREAPGRTLEREGPATEPPATDPTPPE